MTTVTPETLQAMLAPEGRKDHRAHFVQTLRNVPKLVCADGLTFSMQASYGHYCNPRDSEGPWDTVELGFPSDMVEAFMPYAEEPGRPTETVYGYVPLDVVVAVINAHGGLAAQVSS